MPPIISRRATSSGNQGDGIDGSFSVGVSATKSMVAFRSASPSSSHCCCYQHRYSGDVDVAYKDRDASDEDGDVEDVDGDA
ncbi:hypothetical protein RHSIM_Rhsim01G0080700 [Rhododendron simsii]|uniref:Uncharacterized protein n=1 Tax=Rhododendron simsii TaxID=118357 RepID=A0A834HIW2_RHOSS|nr:hypothetical protein RHSIM_Rhsim01G0080700 [Rhododendron simsii]